MPNDPAIKYIPKEVEVIEWNLCNLDSLKQFFTVQKGIKIIVIHVVRMVKVNPEFNQKLVDVNVGGTKNQ